jgi:Tol biopolymer transport system component/DNA-binding winged helix-turn-helix (wHTH) protein
VSRSSAAIVYEFGEFRVDPRRRILERIGGGEVEVTAKVFDALTYFLERSGTVISRNELLGALWPHTVVEENSLHRVIMGLRRALEDGQQGKRYIVTLQGRGYQFVADVRSVDLQVEAAAAVGPGMATLPPAAAVPPTTRSRRFRSYGLPAAVAALLLLALAGAWLWRDPPAATRLGAVAQTSIVTTYPGMELGPALAPDGNRVAFSWDGEDGNRDLYLAQVANGASPQRLTDAPEPDRDPAWSPDGSQIAFLRQRARNDFDVMTVSPIDRTERRIASIRFDQRFASPMLAWTEDGKHLLYPAIAQDAQTSRIVALALETGIARPITVGDDSASDSSPAISRDGRWLVFRREPLDDALPSQLLLQRLSALSPIGEPLPVPSERARLAHSPAWSPDGKSVVYVENEQILEWVVGEAESRVVYSSPQLGGTTAAWETSAMSLVYGASPTRAVFAHVAASADIWALPLDAGSRAATGVAVRRFVSTAGDVHAQYSPDGARVAFISGRNGSQQVWVAPADESSPPLMLTRLDARVALLSWSPDGKQIAFNTARPASGDRILHTVGVDDGVPRRLESSGVSPVWSRDGQALYFTELESRSVMRFDLASGRRETLFPGGFVEPTPDGDSLLYSKFDEPGVFMRSLDGDPAANPEVPVVPDHTLGRGGIAPVDGGFYYTASTSEGVPRAIRFYDDETGEARDIAPVPPGLVEKLSISPDGRELLYASQSSEAGADLILLEFD